MRYVSIDIETTGLNPAKNQILEIGAIVQEFGGTPLGWFRGVVKWDILVGSHFAINLNQDIIKEAMTSGVRITELMTAFDNWLREYFGDNSVVAAGKNFSTFDKLFIEQQKPFKGTKRFKHRFLDPVNMYLYLTDTEPPSLGECLNRAGFENTTVSHKALEDAWQVVQLIEFAYGQKLTKKDFEQLMALPSGFSLDSSLKLKDN